MTQQIEPCPNCAQCGSAAITDDDRPWWRDDLCAACNWRARAEKAELALQAQKERALQALADQAQELDMGYGDG